MLKWLVQKTPDSASLEDVITDDPLATLDLEKIVRRKKAKEIYSVNRTNPLYSEHDYKFLVHHGTAKSSSSGYASRSPNRTTKNTAKGMCLHYTNCLNDLCCMSASYLMSLLCIS